MKRIVGGIIMSLGFIIAAFSSRITSYVISNGTGNESFGILGVLLIGLGMIIMIFSSRKSLELTVYEDKSHRGEYAMVDPSLHLSTSGVVYLSEFKREIEELRREADGDQLVQIIRDEYEPKLVEIAENDPAKKEIALRFLHVLGYKENKKDDEYSLSSEEKRIIKTAFKSFDGNISSGQMKVLEEYGLSYQSAGRGRHGKIVASYSEKKHAIPGSPSDWRAGRNLAGDIIRLIEDDKKAKMKEARKNQ